MLLWKRRGSFPLFFLFLRSTAVNPLEALPKVKDGVKKLKTTADNSGKRKSQLAELIEEEEKKKEKMNRRDYWLAEVSNTLVSER